VEQVENGIKPVAILAEYPDRKIFEQMRQYILVLFPMKIS